MTARGELDALEQGAAIVQHIERGAVLLTGPDTWSFLQAIVSADVTALGDGEGARGLLLSPQGKLGVVFRLLRVGDDAWLDCDPGLGAELAAGLARYRIRVKVEVEDRTGSWGVLSLVGPQVPERWDGPTPTALHAHEPWGDLRVVRTTRGVDLVGPNRALDEARASLLAGGWTLVGSEAWGAYRVAHGIAEQPADLPEGTIPQEGQLEVDTVSFTKGCFVGQELVCRIDSRGHVNRFLRRLVDIEADGWVPDGAEIVAGDAVVGAVTSVAPAVLPVGALGFVRREVEPGTIVELRWADGAARARVAELIA